MQYTETQLTKLIEDVEKEFAGYLAKAENAELEGTDSTEVTLAKAEDGKAPEKKPEEKDGKEEKPEAKDAKPAEEQKPEGEAPPAEAAPQAPGQDQESHDYDEEDIQHMQKMYMSMSKAELKAHHDACRAALDGMGMQKCGDMAPAAAPQDVQKSEIANQERANGGKIESAPPKEVPGAKSPASKVEGVQMEKSENTEVELLKSELNDQKSKFENLQKNFDAVAAFLTKLVEKKAAPAAKAITSLDVIAKSEGDNEEKTLSKSEITEILAKKSQDSSLKKSDRDAINAYYLDGHSVQSISHLLK